MPETRKLSKSQLSEENYTPDRAQKLFASYADEDDPSVIGPEGFERLCADAGISLEGVQPLILAWQLKASEMGKIRQDEWTVGMSALQISSLPVLGHALRDLEDLLVRDAESIQTASTATPSKKRTSAAAGAAEKDPYNRSRYLSYATDKKAAFSELYQFCFVLAKPPQSRNIEMETAIAFWSVLLAPSFSMVSEVIEFLNVKGTYRAANKDLWSMMLEFCRTVDPSLNDYEADGAWPTLLDDFVAWKKAGGSRTQSS